jgi:hypothetical protein
LIRPLTTDLSGPVCRPYFLANLQRRFLEAFAGQTNAFFRTGGAMLVGWVGIRRTDDLDLFEPSMRRLAVPGPAPERDQ